MPLVLSILGHGLTKGITVEEEVASSMKPKGFGGSTVLLFSSFTGDDYDGKQMVLEHPVGLLPKF